jgi:hypothetical protein
LNKEGSRARTTQNSRKAGYEPPLETHTISRTNKSSPTSDKISKPTENRHLAKRIAEAERQLVREVKEPVREAKETIREVRETVEETKESVNKTDLQTTENIPFKMGNKAMITPGARDAPKFSLKRPQELRRFVRQMEDLWREAGIVDDEEKKEGLGKYADHESEEEWKALETYERGNTWDEFKDELISNYPEAAAAERGTPARLKQLCNETKGIQLGDLTTLYAFRRAFIAEAKKLTKPPAAMSNRELVELFIGSLSEAMAAAVLQALGNRAVSGMKTNREEKRKGMEKVVARRPEDRYDLEEVCRAAIQVSEGSQGMFHLMN